MKLRICILQRYLLSQFFNALLICLFAVSSLFFIFDLFEKMRIFLKEDSSLANILSYLFFKIPLIIHLMLPVAVLIATLFSIGRLSQTSEITAMRSSGRSVAWIAKPLLLVALAISLFSFILGETLIPYSSQRVEEIYNFEIRDKADKGRLSRANFWYKSDNTFYDIGFYDSRNTRLQDLLIYSFDEFFNLKSKLNANHADWGGPAVAWTMHKVVEVNLGKDAEFKASQFSTLPLVIKEKPEDFYNLQSKPETLSYFELRNYIAKLRRDGISQTKHIVDLAAKLAFPLVNFLVVLVALPFALNPARSGTMTIGFVAGISIGFSYYFIHALSCSLGAAEFLPAHLSAWAANIIYLCIGGYLLSGAEYK